MPPRKGIVKSGNAGNSSKAEKVPSQPADVSEEKSLFPPGSKIPLSLLHERQVLLVPQQMSVGDNVHYFSDVKRKGGRSLLSILYVLNLHPTTTFT